MAREALNKNIFGTLLVVKKQVTPRFQWEWKPQTTWLCVYDDKGMGYRRLSMLMEAPNNMVVYYQFNMRYEVPQVVNGNGIPKQHGCTLAVINIWGIAGFQCQW